MPTNFDLAEATVNFVAGNEATWNNFVLPIPENVIVYTVDSKKFKKGDGNHRFSELPDGPSIAGIAGGNETVSNVLVQLESGDDDSIIVIDNELYKASTTKLSTIISRLDAIANANTIQTSNLDTIQNQLTLVNTSITSADNDKLAISQNHKMAPGVIPTSLVSAAPSSPINIRSIDFYSDASCTNKITEMFHDSIYYANVDVQHDSADIDSITVGLTETNNFITVSNIIRGKFKISVGQPSIGGNVVFTATATYNTDTISVNKSITLNEYTPIIAAVYGGSGGELFYGVIVDSSDNVICVGYTNSEGSGSNDALIVKFDSSLDISARKVYGGSGADEFRSVAVDGSDNIICVGSTASEGIGSGDALVVKFDNNLNILTRKVYGRSGADEFRSVAVDSSDNIICVGATTSEGSGSYDALIIKFDSNLTISSSKVYGGSSADEFRSVAVDSSDNIICVGSTASEGTGGGSALITKFDNNLNILTRKVYGGSGADEFWSVAVDGSNNIICVGATTSEGSGSYDALIIKFDSSLNILNRKIYGGASDDYFLNIIIDSNDNIICVGYTKSEGTGSTSYSNTLVVKFDNSLSIMNRKVYGGTSDDSSYDVDVDSLGNIICVGETRSEGVSGASTFLLKLPSSIPSGTHTGTILTNLTLADSTLTLANSNLTLANSTLTLANSTLTLANSTLTLANSTLTLEKDTILY